MNDLKNAIKVRNKYNRMPFNEFISLLEKHTGKEISEGEIKAWRFTGLNNIDLFSLKTNQ